MGAVLLAAFNTYGLPLIIKYGIPLMIELAQKMGFFDFAEALAARTADDLAVDIKSLKTYPGFPEQNSKGQVL